LVAMCPGDKEFGGVGNSVGHPVELSYRETSKGPGRGVLGTFSSVWFTDENKDFARYRFDGGISRIG
jgi:hypothetical protein